MWDLFSQSMLVWLESDKFLSKQLRVKKWMKKAARNQQREKGKENHFNIRMKPMEKGGKVKGWHN